MSARKSRASDDRSTSSLRILILRQGFYPEDPRVRREIQALADRGHAVDIVCLRGPGQAARESVAGARVLRLPLGRRRGGLLRYAWDYAVFLLAATVTTTWLAARRRYDLVQVNTMPDFLVWAAWPARLAGAKVLLDLHELMPELFASKFSSGLAHPLPRLLARIETAAAGWADACIAVSQPCLDRYVARGAPAERFTVIMNAADPRLFPPATERDRWRRAQREGPLRLVSHGSLVHRYGYDLLLEAVAQLLDEGHELELEIIGTGEAGADLARSVRQRGLGERVTLVGFLPLDRIAEALRDVDIGVVANRSDAFTDLVVPTKLMEYIALGIPAVAPATPAVTTYFEPDMVRRFTPGSVASLADALRALIEDPAMRQSLALRAGRAFLAQHGWPIMAVRYVDLIEGLAGPRSSAPSRD